MDFKTMLDAVALMARQAGEISRSYQRNPVFQSDFKGEYDLVTNADREAEAFLVEMLKRTFPQIGIIGEEGSNYVPSGADYVWFIDPIDGTNNFAHRLPHFSVSIGLASAEGVPQLGVIYDPMRDECFTGWRGGGAFMNGQPIQVSETKEIHRASFSTGFPYGRDAHFMKSVQAVNDMLMVAQGVRVLGSGALDLAYVACGRLDGYWENTLSRWDCCAGMVILEEAGGKVTDYTGGGIMLRSEKVELLASNGHLHDSIREILQNSHA